jgi:hypothetical protein
VRSDDLGCGPVALCQVLVFYLDIAKRHFRAHMGAAAVSGAEKVQKMR